MEPIIKFGKREIYRITSIGGGPKDNFVVTNGVIANCLPGDRTSVIKLGTVELGKVVTPIADEDTGEVEERTVYGFHIRKQEKREKIKKEEVKQDLRLFS